MKILFYVIFSASLVTIDLARQAGTISLKSALARVCKKSLTMRLLLNVAVAALLLFKALDADAKPLSLQRHLGLSADFTDSVRSPHSPKMTHVLDEREGQSVKVQANRLPVVLWHGMGDTAHSAPMSQIMDLIKSELGNQTFVYSVSLGKSIRDDFDASFFGHAWTQVEQVCREIAAEPKLRGGFNAIGFSQGGLYLRALVEGCEAAKVHNLVTLGAPHAGIMSAPNCSPLDPAASKKCELVRHMIKVGAYWPLVRKSVVQAQYYKDPFALSRYLEFNEFLKDLNNDVVINEDHRRRILRLNRVAMVMFADDNILVPKNSAWFGYYNVTDNNQLVLVPLQDSWHYHENTIGLRTLNEKGHVDFLSWPGEHLHFTDKIFKEDIITPYL